MIYHFTEDQRSHPVPYVEGGTLDEHVSGVAVFIHRSRVYSASAVSFGQVSSSAKNEMQSRNVLRMLEIFGKICEQAARSPFGRLYVEDKSYARYEAFIRELPFLREEPSKSYIIWLRYTEGPDSSENSDMNLDADRVKVSDLKKMKERQFVRDPVWALSRALHESAGGRADPVAQGKTFQANPHVPKAANGAKKRWVDTMTKAQLFDELMFYSGDFDYTYANSLHLHNANNPGNPYNAMGIHRACQLAAAAGADPDYLVPEMFYGSMEFPDHGAGVWRIRLNECMPNRLLQTFFPDQAKPEFEMDDENIEYMSARYYDVEYAEEKGAGNAIRRAKQSVRLNIQRSMLSCAQSQSLEGVRARTQMMYDRELDPQFSFDEQAAIQLSIQRRSCEHSRTVLHPDGNIPNALKALCKAREELLEISPNHNFCMPLPRQTKNLSCLGENIAYQTLALEKIFGVHTLHRECLLLTFCNYHVYCVGSFHPHPMLLGDPMTGKSMGIKYRQMTMAPGTFKVCDHMSAQAFMSKDNSDIHFQVLMSEEFEPSAVGYKDSSDREGRASSGRDMALTDKASAIRALMTSMEMHFSRLVRREDTGSYERDSHSVQTNVEFCGAMNATASDLAANSRSRWLLIPVQNRPRDTASIQSKIVGTTGFRDTAEFTKFRQRMLRDQVVVGHVFLKMYTDPKYKINRAVTDAILVDLLQECTKAGLNGATDIRNFEKTRMLVDVICACRAVWEYFDSGLPGMKNQKEPFKEDDILALGKLLETSVEDLVLAITLTSDQYEDPVMWGAVEAMNRLFATPWAQHAQESDHQLQASFLAQDARAREQAEKNKRKKKEEKKAPPPQEEKKEGMAMSTDGRQYGEDGTETAQSVARRQMRTQIQMEEEKNYINSEWIDRTTQYMTDTMRCNLLAERIRPLMPSKHSLAAVQSFLRNLCHETTDDENRPGNSIPVIQWKSSEDGKRQTLLVSKKMLQNNKQDRLLGLLGNILDKDGMPDLEYITGVPEMRTPFVMHTIIPNHVKERRAEEANKEPANFAAFNMSLEPPNGKDEKKEEKRSPRRPRIKYMIRDPSWVDQSVTLFVRRAITYDMSEDQRDAALRKSAPELFKQPWVEIDCDIEEHGTYRGLASSLTSFETLEQLGFGNVKDATRILIRKTRHECYQNMPTFDTLLQYPECFDSRNPGFLDATRWQGNKRPRDNEAPDSAKRRRTKSDSSDSSLEALRNTRIPTNLGMEISRYRATVDPSFRETKEFKAYQDKTQSIHRETAKIHANLLRTRSSPGEEKRVPSPPPAAAEDEMDEKHVEDEDEAGLPALEAAEKGDQEMQEEPLAIEDDDEQTRSGFEPSAISMLWGRSNRMIE